MAAGRILALVTLSLLAFGALAATASAGDPPRHIAFPVVGKVSYQDDFGDSRWQGSHEGNDVMAHKKSLAVAAEAGRVTKWTSSASAGCMLYLHGKSGTTYLYIHLNNDRTKRNDNKGGCKNGIAYAPGLRSGEHVRRGELLGYVGDSGDANGIHPHLHFELHPHDGKAVSPFKWLNRGRHLLYAAPERVDRVSLRLRAEVRRIDTQLVAHVTRSRASTGRRAAVVKNVTLDLADDLVVERRTKSGRLRAAGLADVHEGDSVSIRTLRASSTYRRQLGRPGVWTAGRILIRR